MSNDDTITYSLVSDVIAEYKGFLWIKANIFEDNFRRMDGRRAGYYI